MPVTLYHAEFQGLAQWMTKSIFIVDLLEIVMPLIEDIFSIDKGS